MHFDPRNWPPDPWPPGDPQRKQGWHNDPTGRHEQRYFVGGKCTGRVRDGGGEGVDPLDAATIHELAAKSDALREGWWTDPTGRFEYRWFSAGVPTSLVRTGRDVHDDELALDELGRSAWGPGLQAPDARYQATDPTAYIPNNFRMWNVAGRRYSSTVIGPGEWVRGAWVPAPSRSVSGPVGTVVMAAGLCVAAESSLLSYPPGDYAGACLAVVAVGLWLKGPLSRRPIPIRRRRRGSSQDLSDGYGASPSSSRNALTNLPTATESRDQPG